MVAAGRPVFGSNTSWNPFAAEPEREVERERERETEVGVDPQRETSGGVVVRDAPDRVRIGQMIGAPVLRKESYPERVARLAPLIEMQVEQVRALADARGLDPTDFRVIYSFDISGEAGEVCAFCGREGCQYRPTAYLKENREIDLLKDAVTIAQEVATSLGISYGMIAYDDDLIPLREVLPPDDLSDRAALLSLFSKFKDRKNKPDITDRAWLDEMLAKWTIDDKYRNVAGQPADAGAMELAIKLMKASSGDGPAGLMLAKSQKPKSSMRPLEAQARRANMTPAGLAVGKEAPDVARNMFSKTLQVKENHGLVETIGSGTSSALSLDG